MQEPHFDLQATKAYAAHKLRKNVYGVSSLVLYGLCIALFSYVGVNSNHLEVPLVALCLIGFPLFAIHLFSKIKLERDDIEPFSRANLASDLSYEIIKRLLKKETINSYALFEAAISSPRGSFIIGAMGVKKSEMLDRCQQAIQGHSMDILSFLRDALELKPVLKEERIDANVILYQLFKGSAFFKTLLDQCDLAIEDVRKIILWESYYHRKIQGDNPFLPENASSFMGSMGRSWVMGYTDQLDALTRDISDGILWRGRKMVVAHRQQLDEGLRILSHSSHRNILILGKVGVGKRTYVENIAYALQKFEKEKSLPYTRVLILKTEELLSGTKNPDGFLLSALGRAEESGRFVLVIPNMGLILQSADANLKAVFVKFLQTRNIYIIGITDNQDYHLYLKNDTALDSLFDKIYLDDASYDESMAVLMTRSFDLTDRYGVQVTYKALKTVLDLSQRYLSRGGLPGKAVDVLQDAVSVARRGGSSFVLDQHIRSVVSQKARVNVTQVSENEKGKLLNLEKELHDHVVGQNEAITSLVSALKRARMDISAGKRPLGTFLFLGPTGVGKTQTAKALADVYFGSEEKIIRLDMNEYSSPDSVVGIIGSPDGSREGYLATRVQDNPFSLILLDEIEKAHKNVLNLFLQILDEGFMMDGRGTKTDFRNAIIIATSNAGSLFIRDYFRGQEQHTDTKSAFKERLLDTLIQRENFSPEFINRFDGVIIFYPLTREETVEVTIMMLDNIISDIQNQKGITIKVGQDVVDAVAEHGYSIEYGAREMRRTITNVIETYLADYFLNHDVRRGDEIVIRKENIKFS